MKTKSNIFKCLIIGMALVIAATALVSCDNGSGGGDDPTPNTAAITSVTITGTAKVGQTLTATAKDSSSATVTDATFQWKKADSADGTYSNIGSATGATYQPVTDDVGKYLKVEADNDATGTAVLSSATAAVAAADNSGGGGGGGSTTPITPEMVYINPGTFSMGQTGWVTPTHSVTISAGFYMGKYEVTQAEFQAVMGTNPGTGLGPGNNYPVYCVNWYDAIAYCNKLSVSEGLTPAYSVSGITDWAGLAYSSIPTSSNSTWDAVTWNKSANGYRLPTEAEWEYACRAGTTTLFSFGDSIDSTKASIGQIQITTVGSYAANPWGLYDMHGNVREWCWDWYGDYSSGAQTDPVGASSGTDRVNRGGDFINDMFWLMSAMRSAEDPYTRASIYGFRVVRPSRNTSSTRSPETSWTAATLPWLTGPTWRSYSRRWTSRCPGK